MLKGEEGFRQRPIVPGACAPSIVGAEAFHDRVRDGYGWADLARVTGNPLAAWAHAGRRLLCQPPLRGGRQPTDQVSTGRTSSWRETRGVPERPRPLGPGG